MIARTINGIRFHGSRGRWSPGHGWVATWDGRQWTLRIPGVARCRTKMIYTEYGPTSARNGVIEYGYGYRRTGNRVTIIDYDKRLRLVDWAVDLQRPTVSEPTS